MQDIDTSLVTVGQPTDGGCVWTTFASSYTLPTTASATMASPWESLGDLSDNGYTESKAVNSTDHKNWHGGIALSTIDETKHKYKLEFIEVNRASTAKLRYGKGNVETDGSGNITHIVGKAATGETIPLVIDELMSNGWLRRTVVRKAIVTSFDDVPHQKGNLMVYGMEFTAISKDGADFDIYFAAPAGSSAAADVTLSALTIASCTLSPTFDKDVLAYTASTTNATNAVTATATDTTNAVVVIRNGTTSVTSGSAATWADGANELVINVINGTATRTYVVTVTKS